jgi:hypothetical protein
MNQTRKERERREEKNACQSGQDHRMNERGPAKKVEAAAKNCHHCPGSSRHANTAVLSVFLLSLQTCTKEWTQNYCNTATTACL